jgi:hypothetical protein
MTENCKLRKAIIIIIINNFIGMTCTGIAKVLSRSAMSTVYLIEQEQML